MLTFVLLIETWGENSIFLLLHVELLRMRAKTSHMQAAFISFYIKCFWFMSPQCLFFLHEINYGGEFPFKKKGDRETGNHRAQGENTREVLRPKSVYLPSSERASAQVLYEGLNMWVKKMRLFSCLTASLFIFLLFRQEINRESGYSLNIYKNKLGWILSYNMVHVMITLHSRCSTDTLIQSSWV